MEPVSRTSPRNSWPFIRSVLPSFLSEPSTISLNAFRYHSLRSEPHTPAERIFRVFLFVQNRHRHIAHHEPTAFLPTVLLRVKRESLYAIFRDHMEIDEKYLYSLPDYRK